MSITKKLMFWKKTSNADGGADSKSVKKPVASKSAAATEAKPAAAAAAASTSEIPTTMKAVVIEGDRAAVKSDVPLPELEDGFVLLKTIAVAGNPTDWKHIDYNIGPKGSIIGCDVVGKVVKLGPNADSDISVGDNLYGFVHGSSVRFPTNGAFAEYVAIDSKIAYRAPKTMVLNNYDTPEGVVDSFEGAVSLPVSLTTAGLVLTHTLGIKLDWEPKEAQNDFPVLIWGGATGVGQCLVQLAKKLNAYSKILVVASKKHEDQMKTYGADEVFDYHDEDVIEQITSKYNNIQHLIDGVSNKQTFNQLYRCAAAEHDATVLQLVTMTAADIEEPFRRDNIKIVGNFLYAAAGKEVPFGTDTLPADEVYRENAIKFVKFITPKLDNGEIHHIPVTVFKNGLEDVPKMLEDIKSGKNSGEKYVAVLGN